MENFVCAGEVCQIPKSLRTPASNNPQPRKSVKLELVFSDLLARMPKTFLGVQRFAIPFVDSFGRFGAVCFVLSSPKVNVWINTKCFALKWGHQKYCVQIKVQSTLLKLLLILEWIRGQKRVHCSMFASSKWCL